MESLRTKELFEILDLSSDVICAVDSEGLIKYSNRSFHEKVGIPTVDDNFRLKTWFSEEDFFCFRERIQEVKQKEREFKYVVKVESGGEQLLGTVNIRKVSDYLCSEELFLCVFHVQEEMTVSLSKIRELLTLDGDISEKNSFLSLETRFSSILSEVFDSKVLWCPFDNKAKQYVSQFEATAQDSSILQRKLFYRYYDEDTVVQEAGRKLCTRVYSSLPELFHHLTITEQDADAVNVLPESELIYVLPLIVSDKIYGEFLFFSKKMKEDEILFLEYSLRYLSVYLKTKAELQFYKENFYKYKFGIDAIGAATWEWNIADGTIIFSRKWAEMMGFRYDELSDRIEDWKERWHPDEKADNEKLLQAYLRGEVCGYNPVYRMKHKDGHWKWIMTRGHLLRDADGSPLTFSGFHVDITESENHKALYLKEREKYLSIIEATRAGTWEWNIQTGENKYNERWAEIVGYTLDELEPITDETWSRLVHPEDLQESNRLIQSLFYKEREFYSMECRMKHKEGHWVWVLDKGNVVSWTEDGKPLYMYGTHIDITEAKQLEMEIKESEDNYKFLVESSYDIVYRIGKDASFQFVSTAWEKVLGHSVRGALGQSFEPYVHPEDLPRITDFFRHIETTGERRETTEYRLLHQDGTYHWFTTNAVPIYDEEGAVTGFAGIARDITEVKKANLKVMQQKDELERFFKVNLDYFCITDTQGNFLKVNDAWQKVLGYDNMLLLKTNAMSYVHPEDIATLKESVSVMVREQREGSFTLRFRQANDCYAVLEWKAQYIDNLIYAAARDVTEKKKLEETLFIEKELFRTTLLSVGDGVIATDEKYRVLLMNTAAQEITGWTLEEAKGRLIDEIYSVTTEGQEVPYEKRFETGLDPNVTGTPTERTLLQKNGDTVPIEENISPINGSDLSVTGIVAVFRDITEKFEKQRQAEYLSYHDVLTGLYNRRFLEDALKRLEISRNLPLSVMVMDINGLKLTNDAFGHDLGDLLLKKSAEIMQSQIRDEDILARVGGDEFVLLMPKTSYKEAEMVKADILSEASRTVLGPINVSIAVGYATKTIQSQNILEVQKVADNNMYREKLKHGKVMKGKLLETIMGSMQQKFPKEEEHHQHVADFAKRIGYSLGLKEDALHRLYMAGKLHDIGKIALPHEILMKPGPLSYEEYEVIKKHAEISYQIIKSVEEYGYFAEDVLYHHERYDGTGYPEGLRGEEIPLHSRILCVADAYEAMTNERPYSTIRTPEEAAAELCAHSGTQFDPEIVQVFVQEVLQLDI